MDADSLKKLRERLYKKGESFSDRKDRIEIRRESSETPAGDWTSLEQKESPNKFISMKKIFITAVIFFSVSLIAFLVFWSRGTNIISARNISIDVRAPLSVSGGEVFPMDISVENKNNNALEMTDIVIAFPSGSFSDTGEQLSRERYPLGRIGAGGFAKKTLGMILFGEEEEEKELKIELEYRVEGSNAIFAKEEKYILRISKPAVGVSISLPKETTSRQDIAIEVEVVSNSEAEIKDLVLQVEYPPGFNFLSALPEPAMMNNVWLLGDLEPAQKRKIVIQGSLEGQDLEEKSFRAQAGVFNDEDVLMAYGAAAETIGIKKPYLDMVVFLNGKDAERNIFFSGDSIRGEMVWRNNLSSSVRNAVVEMKISGKALDQKSVSVSGGFYRTFDKVLVWNSSSNPSLALINPGDTGSGKFSFSILNPLPINSIDDNNFSINIEAKITGRTASEELGDIEIDNKITKEIKIGSLLQLSNRILRYSGAFKNTGPMPPKAGSETTYTVVWSVGNLSNNFSGARVKAILPPYVRWMGKASPSSEIMSYEESTGEVVWNIGNLPAGTGVINPAREVSFQISFMPSLSQVGRTPVLIEEATIEGKDIFTGDTVSSTKDKLTTRLTSDPQFSSREGQVVE